MRESMYDELALERTIRQRFGIDIDVRQVIVSHIRVSHVAEATLFLTTNKQFFMYVSAESHLLLGDVKKIVSKVGVKAELYIPPKGHPHYFDDIGKAKFRVVFPGRSNISSEDIIFYRTLAPYNPALIQLSSVTDGTIYQFDTDASSGWRPAVKFAYRRLKTS